MASKQDASNDDLKEIEARVAAAKAATTTVEESPMGVASDDKYAHQTQSGGTLVNTTAGELVPYRDRSRDVKPSDFYLPRLKLLQGLSKECKGDNPKPQGHWYLEGNAETFGPEIVVAPLFKQDSRAFLIPGRGLMCRSTDMVYGQGNPGVRCGENEHDGCELKNWPEKKDGDTLQMAQRGGPPCSEVMNFPCIVVPKDPNDDYQIGLLAFTRTGYKQGQLIMTIHAGSEFPRDQMYRNKIVVGRFSTSNSKGEYYVPTVTRGGKSDERTIEYAQSILSKINPDVVAATLQNESFGND